MIQRLLDERSLQMKKVRLLALLLTGGLVLTNPSLLRSSQCCPEFGIFCQGFCYEHGGVQITNCYGWECSEVCWCNDINPATGLYWQYSGGPNYCPPCS